MAGDYEAASDLAYHASVKALEMAGCRAEDLDMIVVGTISASMPLPSCAAFLQAKLGAKKAFAFDSAAACAGSIYGMSVASQFIATGAVKRALVVASRCSSGRSISGLAICSMNLELLGSSRTARGCCGLAAERWCSSTVRPCTTPDAPAT